MARRYSRNKGKSGSRKVKPSKISKLIEMSPVEVENLVLKLWEEKKNPALVGCILRDKYGIGSVKEICGKSISEILSKKYKYPYDLIQLMKKAVNLREHLENNKSDKHNRYRLLLIESKIRSLGKYYSRKKILPKDWIYDPEQAKLIVKGL